MRFAVEEWLEHAQNIYIIEHAADVSLCKLMDFNGQLTRTKCSLAMGVRWGLCLGFWSPTMLTGVDSSSRFGRCVVVAARHGRRYLEQC
jgi:hypothetical protein